MLTTLKTDNWINIPPLAFYFTPLLTAVTDVRTKLLDMNKEGILKCKYVIEHNEELMAKTVVMV